jgi:hypothetical protein
MGEGDEPVEDAEVLYRRVPELKMDLARRRPLDVGFRPHPEKDHDGISLFRAKYHPPKDLRGRQSRRPCWFAVLVAVDLRRIGLGPVPRPIPEAKGHVTVPELNSSNGKTDQALKWQQQLADEITREVLGPFEPISTS